MKQSYEPGLLTSLHSVILGKEDEFQKGLLTKYQEYLEKLIEININHAKNVTKKDEKYLITRFEELYQPITFLSWGNFDLICLSLIDDFEILHKLALLENQNTQQLHISYTPYFDEQIKLRSIKDIFAGNLHEKYPFIGISQMKFNPVWTNILGNDLFKNFFISYSNNIDLKRFVKSEIFLLRSLSWSEIQFVIFSNSYQEITDIVLFFRELTLEHTFPRSHFDEIWKAIESDRLISRLVKRPHEPKYNHSFITTYSIYGIKYAIYKNLIEIDYNASAKINLPSSLSKVDNQDIVYFFTELACKPGHIKTVQSMISKLYKLENKKLFVMPGKQDLLLSNIDNEFKIPPKPLIENITDFVKCHKLLKENDQQHILKTRSTLILQDRSQGEEIKDEKHFSFFLEFEKAPQKMISKINKVRKKCYRFGIPKNLIFVLEHIFSSFLNCVQNYWVVDGFIELYPFVNRLIDFLSRLERSNKDIIFKYKVKANNFVKISRAEIVDLIQDYAKCFKEAFEIRYTQSYAMNEFTDFTIEFKGSLYQLLTGINGIHQALLSVNREKRLRSGFILISGEPITNTLSLMLGSVIYFNYHSIFEPLELYTIYHELAHYCFETEWIEIKELMGKDVKKYIKLKNDKNIYKKKKLQIDLECEREYVEQIFCDNFAFNFGFGQNIDLFSRVFWGRYQSMKRLSYEDPKKEHEAFGEYLSRYILAGYPRLRSLIYEYISNNKRNNIDVKNKFKKILMDMVGIGNYEELLKIYIDSWLYGEQEEKKKAGKFLLRVLESCVFRVEVFLGSFIKMEEIFKEKLKVIFHDFLQDNQFQISKKYEMEINKIRRDLVKGQTYQFNINEVNKDAYCFRLAQQLLYAYFVETLSFIKDKSPCLIRKDGKPIFSEGGGCLYFDSVGGTFVCDPDFRRFYFNYRLATMTSFWGFAQRRKQILNLDLLGKEKVSLLT